MPVKAPLASYAGVTISTVSILPLISNIECVNVHACTFADQGCTVPEGDRLAVPLGHLLHVSRLATMTCRTKLSAELERNWIIQGVIASWKFVAPDGPPHQRMKPSG